MPDRIVVDANVVISSLINKGTVFSGLLLNSVLKRFELVGPEFLLEEIGNHESKLLKYSRLSKQEFKVVYRFLLNEILLIPAVEFLDYWPEAVRIAPHIKDAPYVALSLGLKAPLLTGDKGLHKSGLDVISPGEFLALLLKD